MFSVDDIGTVIANIKGSEVYNVLEIVTVLISAWSVIAIIVHKSRERKGELFAVGLVNETSVDTRKRWFYLYYRICLPIVIMGLYFVQCFLGQIILGVTASVHRTEWFFIIMAVAIIGMYLLCKKAHFKGRAFVIAGRISSFLSFLLFCLPWKSGKFIFRMRPQTIV